MNLEYDICILIMEVSILKKKLNIITSIEVANRTNEQVIAPTDDILNISKKLIHQNKAVYEKLAK